VGTRSGRPKLTGRAGCSATARGADCGADWARHGVMGDRSVRRGLSRHREKIAHEETAREAPGHVSHYDPARVPGDTYEC